MSKDAMLSTLINADVKEAATQFCKSHGLKLRFLIERALIEQIEDYTDLEAYRSRQDEPTVPFHKVLAKRKKK